MVQQVEGKLESNLCDLRVEPLSGVDVNDAAARLQSRGDTSGNNIFEILPRFSIGSGDSNQNWDGQYTRRRDEVLTVTGGGNITGIVVGCELLAFDRDKEEPLKQLHFPANIDFIVWRRSIMLIGSSSSELLLVDPSTYGILFRWQAVANLEGQKRFFVDAFIHSNPDPSKIDVIVVARDGVVYTFRDISLSGGSLDATHDQNVSLDVDLGSIKDISKLTIDISSNISCVCSPTRDVLVVVEERGNILVTDLLLNKQNSTTVLNVFCNIDYDLSKTSVVPKKLVTFEGTFFVLLSNGMLQIFLEEFPYTSKPLSLPASGLWVHDFSLVRNDNEGVVKLWVLYTVNTDSKAENFVGIFGGPAFTSEFNFQLPNLTKSAEPTWFKFPKNISPTEEPSSIVEMAAENIFMYHILETSTDITLQKLLSRGKYLEAEDLARNYGKDLDIVRKAEARDKLSKLTASHSSVGNQCLKIIWNELLTLLREINDAEFVCKFCVDAQLHSVEWVKEILGLGKGRVSGCRSSSAAHLLLLTLKKFYTFELVYPSGTINEWHSFISPDNTMFIQGMKFLQNHNFEKCERIWKRHSDEFIHEILLDKFLPFFNILFDHQLRTSESVSLLKTILPFAVDKLAQSISANPQEPQESFEIKKVDILLSIVQRQVCTLESHIEWPVNALKFIKVLIVVIKEEIKRLETTRTEQESVLQKKMAIVQYLSDKLNRLEQILEELAELKRNHSIRILFHDYTTNDIPEVVNKLLYKLLSQEEVEGFVSKYLRPYAARKRLNIDNWFVEHIKSVLQYIHYYIQAINIPHEERIICLVNLISSVKTKLECTLLISKEWPVPWTPGIASMVERILLTPKETLEPGSKVLYDSIVEMQKQVPYRCVINKYKLNSSKLCSRRAYVSMALLRILKLRKPGYEADCIELLKPITSKTLIDEVHLDYIEYILRMYNEKIEEEDVLPANMDPQGNLRKALLQRVLIELQLMEHTGDSGIYTEEEQLRCIKIYSLLANASKDPRNSILSKLKLLTPSIPLDIIYDPEFPYACLGNICKASDSYIKDPMELIGDCKKLSRITKTYLPDILIFVGSYFIQDGLPGSPRELLWCIVEHIVNTPLDLDMNNTSVNRELLTSAAYQIVSVLMLQCPELSHEQMSCLQEFICRLSSSFDQFGLEMGPLLCFLRIFFSLKEQEIPLEHEFLEVYKWCGGSSSSPWEVISEKMILIGETLVKFGEKDLCSAIFKSVQRHLRMFILTLDNPPAINYYSGVLEWIKNANSERWEKRLVDEDQETNSQMRKLVQDLNEAGIRVNGYALKIRNKLKLLERLLKLKAHFLAAKLAIAFIFYDNNGIWSRILEGLVASSGEPQDLRQVLEHIRTVPQLWMLPEFSAAWRKVSETDKTFFDLCPIPLE